MESQLANLRTRVRMLPHALVTDARYDLGAGRHALHELLDEIEMGRQNVDLIIADCLSRISRESSDEFAERADAIEVAIIAFR